MKALLSGDGQTVWVSMGFEQSLSFLDRKPRTDLSHLHPLGTLSPASFLHMPCRQTLGLIPTPQKPAEHLPSPVPPHASQLLQPHVSPLVHDGGCPCSECSTQVQLLRH